jgi:HEAT repeat protein
MLTRETQSLIEAAGSGDLGAIRGLLEAPNPDLRRHGLYLIRKLQLDEAMPDAVEHCNDETASVRTAAALALADRRDAAYADVLLKLVNDESQDVRQVAMRGLAKLSHPASPSIAKREYLSAENATGRTLALAALGLYGGRQAEEILRELLREEQSPWRRRSIRRAIRRRKPGA